MLNGQETDGRKGRTMDVGKEISCMVVVCNEINSLTPKIPVSEPNTKRRVVKGH